MARRRLSARLTVIPLGLALAGAAAAVHGCTIMNGLTVPVRDGGADAGADAATDPCDHAYAPFDPPQIPEDGDLSFVTAIRDIDFGLDPPDGGAPNEFAAGFDLDRTCTCPAPPSCTSSIRSCDDVRGRDDAFAALIRQLASKGLDMQGNVRDALSKGANGMLVLVEGYNGRPDDAQVKVTLATSLGLRDPEPDGGLTIKRTPTWTRADKWVVIKREFFEVSGVVQAVNRQSGYVKNNKLVVRIDKGQLQLGEQGFVLGLASGFLVGAIESDGEGSFYVAGGELGGRWATHTALASAREVQLTKGLDPVCRLPGDVYGSIKQEICNAADISADTAKDNAAARCDAVSVAVRFQGAPGSRGPLYDSPTTNPCPEPAPGEEDCPP